MLGGGAADLHTCPGGSFLTTLANEGDSVVFQFQGGTEFSCSKMIEVECGAPAFQVQANSGTVYSEFLIYWEEYDPSRISAATQAFDPNSALSTRKDMGIKAGMAKLDQAFYYSGEASAAVEGYPGYTGTPLTVTQTTYKAIVCDDWNKFWSGIDSSLCADERPESTTLTGETPEQVMQRQDFGLGKPTAGQYDAEARGWKTFGGQGQGTTATGWKESTSPTCEKRYMMVLVMNKNASPGATQPLSLELKSVPFAATPYATVLTKSVGALNLAIQASVVAGSMLYTALY